MQGHAHVRIGNSHVAVKFERIGSLYKFMLLIGVLISSRQGSPVPNGPPSGDEHEGCHVPLLDR